MIKEIDSIQQTCDLDSCPKRSINKILDHIKLVDNSLFEVDANWTFDNTLFELNTKDLSDFRVKDDLD